MDGNSTQLPAGVTEEDVAIIDEARHMMAELVCREFVVPKNAQNQAEIFEFLAYLTSDRAQKVAAQKCNGLPVLNYGYVPTEEDMGFACSEFVKSLQPILEDAVIIDIAKLDSKAGRSVGLNWYSDTTVSGGTLCENLYSKQALPVDSIYESTLNAYKGNWADRIEQYMIRYGLQ